MNNHLSVYLVSIQALILCLFSQSACALSQSTGEQGTNAKLLHQQNITGDGVSIGLLCAAGARQSHEAFFDKDENFQPVGESHLFNHDYTGDGFPSNLHHDTWMAGIAISRGGVTHPNEIGIAPGADLHTARVINNYYSSSPQCVDQALYDLIVNHNCRVITAGFALGSSPDGMSDYTLIADYYAQEHDVFLAMPAGNSPDKISVFGDAYNGLTAGGLRMETNGDYQRVGHNSGHGLTDDQRYKPDLVTPAGGQIVPGASNSQDWTDENWTYYKSVNGETSLSVPHLAGTAALLLDYADSSPNPYDHHPEVLRAVMLTSAFPNINDKDGNSTVNEIYHFQRGYGRLNAYHAWQILNTSQISKNSIIDAQRGWAREHIRWYDTHTYFFRIKKKQRLVLSLAWDRRIEKNGDTYLPFNTELELTCYVTTSSLPLYRQSSLQNNTLKIDLLFLQAGTYMIKVANKSFLEETDYAMAFEVIDPLPGDVAESSYVVDLNDLSCLWKSWMKFPAEQDIDLYKDFKIDMKDYSSFSKLWLSNNPAYYCPPQED